jgi:hypothetical protein
VHLKVDNKAVVFGWQKKYTVKDPETSLLLRTLHVIEAFLECKVYVTHLRRMTTEIASLADHLSREKTTTAEIRASLSSVPWVTPTGALVNWLRDPLLDWDLPLKVLGDVKTLCRNP